MNLTLNFQFNWIKDNRINLMKLQLETKLLYLNIDVFLRNLKLN